MPLPENFKDRSWFSRLGADILILLRRKKIKAVCCKSYENPEKMRACKGCPNVYAVDSTNVWRRFLAWWGLRREGEEGGDVILRERRPVGASVLREGDDESISWGEVFVGWREGEGSSPEWLEVARAKGWPDWESWRLNLAKLLKLPEREWKRCEFEDWRKQIPLMLVGPYPAWQSRHPNKNNFTFSDLLWISEQFSYWQERDKIKQLIENWPEGTEMIGFKRQRDGKIVCIEGHHRAVAVTLAGIMGIDLKPVRPPVIALTILSIEDERLLDEALERGTANN